MLCSLPLANPDDQLQVSEVLAGPMLIAPKTSNAAATTTPSIAARLDGGLNLLTPLFCSCRIRSRDTPRASPIALRVGWSGPLRQNRSATTRACLGGSTSRR